MVCLVRVRNLILKIGLSLDIPRNLKTIVYFDVYIQSYILPLGWT